MARLDAAVDPASAGTSPRRSRKAERDALPIGAPSRLPQRRYRQTVQKLDLWSVLKLSLCFYLCGLIVTIVAGVVLWLIGDAFGVIHDVEHFMNDLLSSKNFKFLSAQILEGTILVGLVLVAVMTIITVVAAAFYNLFAELVGGIEVVIVEDDIGPRV